MKKKTGTREIHRHQNVLCLWKKVQFLFKFSKKLHCACGLVSGWANAQLVLHLRGCAAYQYTSLVLSNK